MPRRRHCPPPALRSLLEASLSLGTTNNKELARHLFVSEETIKSNFRRMAVLLDTHSRTETVLGALARGWVELPERRAAPRVQ